MSKHRDNNIKYQLDSQAKQHYFDLWCSRLQDIISGFRLNGNPLQVRYNLRQLCKKLEHNSEIKNEEFLLLLFGSLARGEQANDIDLIVVIEDISGASHFYKRVYFGATQVDLNLVSRTWLEKAWADPERGYCISESYVLAVKGQFEEVWRIAANKFYSWPIRKIRMKEHRSDVSILLNAAQSAETRGRIRISRLLLHEAIRRAASAVIDHSGTRIYSHRSFLGEFRHSCRRAGIPIEIESVLLRGLCRNDTSFVTQANVEYLDTRRNISALLRSPEMKLNTEYRAYLPLRERVDNLVSIASSPWGSLVEHYLFDREDSKWLPETISIELARTSLEKVWRYLRPHRPISLSQESTDEIKTPVNSSFPGVRWLEYSNNRLKLIVSTGGCKTPTCTFCLLPRYGRIGNRIELSQSLALPLKYYGPSDLALYNDGSLLNQGEINHSELFAACKVIREFGIKRLWIESIPRFVTRKILETLRELTGVESLIVGMGLQSVGNWFAIPYLGRPDVDSLFDRAIDEIRDAGAKTRLYLLWDYNVKDLDFWESRLLKSLRWACSRRVEFITVCPYVSSKESQIKKDKEYSLFRLKRILSSVENTGSTHIGISFQGKSSCGFSPKNINSKPCEETLNVDGKKLLWQFSGTENMDK